MQDPAAQTETLDLPIDRLSEAIEETVADETWRFMSYPDGTAGAVMYSEFVSFRANMTVQTIKQDTALASGQGITAITDMCGFLLILGGASLLMPFLV